MKSAIINTTLVMPDHLIPNATIVVENGKITEFGKKVKADDCEVFDAKGMYTGNDKKILFVVVNPKETVILQNIVKRWELQI